MKTVEKRYLLTPAIILATVFSLVVSSFAFADPVTGWQAGDIVSDGIFTNASSMNVAQIQAFLNSKVPSCDTNGTQPASDFGRSDLTHAQYAASQGWPAPPYTCLRDYVDGGVGSAQLIYNIAQTYQINPQVLIVLLQKEQGLVTDNWPLPSQYKTATGYGCPDTAPCDSQYYGLTNQLTWAGKMYRAILNNSPTWYTPYVLGNNFIQYNPDSSCGGSTVNIDDRSTQALYNYTPYQPNDAALAAGFGTVPCGAYGNRNFFLYFQNWFGSTRFGRCVNGATGNKTDVLFRKINGIDYADFSIQSGSGTGCVETHLWNQGFTTWKLHSATMQPSISTPDVELLYGDLDGNKNDYPVFVALNNTGSSTIEAHVLDRGLQSFLVHTGSNQATVDPTHQTVALGDPYGEGKDQAFLINYDTGSSGKVEISEWNPGLQSWKNHVVTNMPAIPTADNVIEFGDLNGDGKDEVILVALRNTGSGRIEFHVWNPDLQTWSTHIATNMPAIDPSTGKVVFADINGDGKDEAILVGTKGTGSGHIEFHVWNPGFTTWNSHIISNQTTP